MKLRRAPSDPTGESILPMIDVVFFLLVFFMIIGRMDATAPFEVDPPITDVGADLPGGGITLAISADGAVALDGQEVSPGIMLDSLAERIAADPAVRIRINADARAPLGRVLPLVGWLEDTGAEDVVLVVSPGRS